MNAIDAELVEHSGDIRRLIVRGDDAAWPPVAPPSAVEKIDAEHAILGRVDPASAADDVVPPAGRRIAIVCCDVARRRDAAEHDDDRRAGLADELVVRGLQPVDASGPPPRARWSRCLAP